MPNPVIPPTNAREMLLTELQARLVAIEVKVELLEKIVIDQGEEIDGMSRWDITRQKATP